MEKIFQISNWLEDASLKQKKKQEQYSLISSRFIHSAPTQAVANNVSKAMTPNNVEKFMYVIDSFSSCPEAWKKLKEMYDKYGEDSGIKMNSLYPIEFRKLDDQCKCLILAGIETGSLKTAGIL